LSANTVQSGPEKIARSLIHRHFATVCSRIMRFTPKCSEITGNMRNWYMLNIVIKQKMFGSW